MDTWSESGAMVYVAITVAILSAVVMCCVWTLRRHPLRRPTQTYNTVDDEEKVELCEAVAIDEAVDVDEDITSFVLGDEEEDDDEQMDAV